MRQKILLLLCIIIILLSLGCQNPDTATDEDIPLVVIEEGNIITGDVVKETGQNNSITEEVEEKIPEISFDYTVEGCDDAVNAENISNLGIKSIDWINRETAIITAYISMRCDESVHKADFEIEEKILYLTYMINHCDDCQDCTCAKKITFVVNGIQKDKYEYKLMGL